MLDLSFKRSERGLMKHLRVRVTTADRAVADRLASRAIFL
jgi:hypothetical protein